MTLIQRVQAPTPRFFKTIRNGGLILATIGASLLAAPAAALPLWILKLAGYLTVAGAVATAVSQVTTSDGQPHADGNGA